MTLLIDQTLVKEVDAISELARQATAFIDGGTDWLRWAVHGNKIRGAFSDESHMVGGIQAGLHGTPFTYLNGLGLLVSPIKLMTFSLEDLRLTAQTELDPSNPRRHERVNRIFDAHGLLTVARLDQAKAWLNGFNLSDSGLFAVMTFTEQAALADLQTWVQDLQLSAELCEEAARFAASESRAPLEFMDFFRVYIGATERLGAHAHEASQRWAAALSAVRDLSHLAFNALDCPQIEPLSKPDDVALAVEYWAAAGRPIGFSRISACVREIVLHTRFVGGEGWNGDRPAWAYDRLNAYLERALALMRRAKITHPRMAQDGATCHYTLAAGDYVANLQLDPTGIITLSRLQEIEPIEASIDPFSPPPHVPPAGLPPESMS